MSLDRNLSSTVISGITSAAKASEELTFRVNSSNGPRTSLLQHCPLFSCEIVREIYNIFRRHIFPVPISAQLGTGSCKRWYSSEFVCLAGVVLWADSSVTGYLRAESRLKQNVWNIQLFCDWLLTQHFSGRGGPREPPAGECVWHKTD